MVPVRTKDGLGRTMPGPRHAERHINKRSGKGRMANPFSGIPVDEAMRRIEKSAAFKQLRSERPQAYLAHAFITRSAEGCGTWQVGFYDREQDRIIVAEVNGEAVALHPPEEVYKEPGRTILPLKEEDVTVPVADAVATMDARMREAYTGELSNKDIILLQNLPEWGAIWNITALTTAFHVINFKIDAKTGKILSESRESLTTIGKKEE
jgi:hypothetical protein